LFARPTIEERLRLGFGINRRKLPQLRGREKVFGSFIGSKIGADEFDIDADFSVTRNRNQRQLIRMGKIELHAVPVLIKGQTRLSVSAMLKFQIGGTRFQITSQD